MKTLHIAVTVLSAVLASGAVLAQGAPDARGEDDPQGKPEFRQRQAMRGGPGQRDGQRGGPQMEFRGQRGGPHGGQGGDYPSPESLKEAGATDEQIEKIKKVQEENKLKQVDLKAAVEKAQLELKQLMTSEKPDKDAIFAAVDKAAAARTALMKNGISARLQAREILGDEIAKKLRKAGHQRDKGPDGQKPRRGRGEKDAPPDGDEEK